MAAHPELPTGYHVPARVVRIGAIAVVLLIALVALRLFVFGSVDRAVGADMLLRVVKAAVAVAHPGADFATAEDGQVVSEGDQARTDATGSGIVSFFDGSTMTLDPNTVVTLEAADESGNDVTFNLTQSAGRTWSNVRKFTGSNSRFEVKTPAITASVRGTGFELIVGANGNTTVRVGDGTVGVTAQGATVNVQPGFETTVVTGQAPPAPAPWSVPRMRVVLRTPAPDLLLAVVDQQGRTCGLVDPQAIGISLRSPFTAAQIPLCLVSPLAGGIATVEVGQPGGGLYTVVVFPGTTSGSFALEASGVRGQALIFDVGTSGDIVPGRPRATQLTLSAAADGTLTSSTFSPIVRIGAVPEAEAPTRLATVTLLDQPTVALVALSVDAPVPPRAAEPPPAGAFLSVTGALFAGAFGSLLLGILLVFGERLKPLMYAATLAGAIAFIILIPMALLFLQVYIANIFYTVARALR